MSLSEKTKAAVAAALRDHGGTYRAALALVMAERQAAEWNARWAVGTPCVLETYRGGPKLNTRTRSEAWVMPSGHASVLVEGRAGCYGLEWLTPGEQLPEVTP
jgi:broad specificity phosphatase PhoE